MPKRSQWEMIKTNKAMGPSNWGEIATDIQRMRAEPAMVNRLVNAAIRYAPDTHDEWTSPQEVIKRGKGDCEDIALVKMALLPDWDTFLSVGHTHDGRPHAVALIRSRDGEVWVADNLHQDLYKLDGGRFKPAYALDTMGGRWLCLEVRELES